MDIVKKRLLVGIALSVVLISGCAAKNASTGSAAQTGAAANNGNGGGASAREQGPGGGNRNGGFALTMGKIKSVSTDAITIYTASGGMNRPQGVAPGGNGENEGKGTDSGGQRGQRSNPFTFSEETTDLKITADTKFTTVTFEDNQRVEKEIALSDLKEDDVIQYTFKDGTQEAATVTLSNGFGGAGGNMGGMPQRDGANRPNNQQQAPGQSQSPAASVVPSA